MIYVDVDLTRIQRQLQALHVTLLGSGKASDASKLVKQETALFSKQVFKNTPPRIQAQGRKRVLADINRAVTIFYPADAKGKRIDELGKEVFSLMDPAVQRSAKNRNYDGVRNWMREKMPAWKLENMAGYMQHFQVHKSRSRGRIERSMRLATLDESAWWKYARKIQKHVGYIKSGWLPVMRDAGLRGIPQWVTRHSFALPGMSRPELVGTNPSMTFGNGATGIGQMRHFVAQAARARVQALARRLATVMRLYGVQLTKGQMVTSKVGKVEFYAD